MKIFLVDPLQAHEGEPTVVEEADDLIEQGAALVELHGGELRLHEYIDHEVDLAPAQQANTSGR